MQAEQPSLDPPFSLVDRCIAGRLQNRREGLWLDHGGSMWLAEFLRKTDGLLLLLRGSWPDAAIYGTTLLYARE